MHLRISLLFFSFIAVPLSAENPPYLDPNLPSTIISIDNKYPTPSFKIRAPNTWTIHKWANPAPPNYHYYLFNFDPRHQKPGIVDTHWQIYISEVPKNKCFSEMINGGQENRKPDDRFITIAVSKLTIEDPNNLIIEAEFRRSTLLHDEIPRYYDTIRIILKGGNDKCFMVSNSISTFDLQSLENFHEYYITSFEKYLSPQIPLNK